MRMSVDTENYENIKLIFSEEDYEKDLTEAIDDFCFAMAALFVDFAMQIDCDVKKAEGLKSLCMRIMDRHIKTLLKEGVLED